MNTCEQMRRDSGRRVRQKKKELFTGTQGVQSVHGDTRHRAGCLQHELFDTLHVKHCRVATEYRLAYDNIAVFVNGAK